MSVLRWSLDYEKQQYYISEKDYADLLERYRKIITDCHMHSISAHYISVHQKFINKQQPC